MNKQVKVILLFLVVALTLRLFDTRLIAASIVNYFHFGTCILLILISLPYVFATRGGFALPVQVIMAAVLLSIFMAKFSWSQSFQDTLMETYPYFTWIFFFFLMAHRFPRRKVEIVIISFTLIYIVLFAFQFTNHSTIYFGKSLWGDDYTSDRGDMARIIFPGAGIFILGIFMAANKLTMESTRHKWLWSLIVIAGLVIPVLQLTREFIAGVLVMYTIHFMRHFDAGKRIAVLIGFAALATGIVIAYPNIIEGISESTRRDLGEGSNYIRVLAAKYYLFEFSPNLESAIFGNGAPYIGESVYGVYVENIEVESGYYMSDVGLIGMYAMFGVAVVIAWFMIWYTCFTMELPKRYQYLRYYLGYLLLTSLTWYSVYHYHYLISTVLCLYLCQRALEDQIAPES